MSDRSKTVIVQVDGINEAQQDDYEITFSNSDGKMTDLEAIWNKVNSKNKSLRDVAKNCDAVFKRTSLVRPDTWVVIGDDSPVKDGMVIKCSMKLRTNLVDSPLFLSGLCECIPILCGS